MARRNTIQRSLVLEAVNKLHCHATADEVYEEIIKEHPTISKATVYRNLNLLSDMGEIRRLEIPGSADRFDHITRNHCHVKCKACGRVFDVDMDFVTGLEMVLTSPVMTSSFMASARNARNGRLPFRDKFTLERARKRAFS